MSESDTSASVIVRQTRLEYEEMRRKLAETERKLKKLARLESKSVEDYRDKGRLKERHEKIQSHISSEGNPFLLRATASLEDLESVRSELSTVPGSYTGFANQPFPASTPSKKKKDALKPADENYNSDTSGESQEHQRQTDNVKLLRQNQHLLSEVERLVGELHFTRQKEAELKSELSSHKGHVADLQDKVEELQSETEALDRALRSSEEHLTESQQQVVSLQQQLLSCRQEVAELRLEVQEERRIRTSVEKQRDEAIQNFLEVQESLEKYQRHTHEKIKALENSEDYLRDSLTHTNEERNELLQRVESLQANVAAHEQEIERLHALNALEQETKNDMEAQTLELRQQLAKVTTRLQKCENEVLEISILRQENATLSSEVEENCEVISQLEELVKQLQHLRAADQQQQTVDDSGHASVHLGASFHSMSGSLPLGKHHSVSQSHSDNLGANTNNNGKTVAVVLNELRAMLFDMDKEIRRLRNRLSTQEEDSRVIQELQAELSLLTEKAIQGEEQTSEMEKLISRVETDKARYARELLQSQEEVASRDTQIHTLEARLSQRNTQIIELQEDVSRRCSEVSHLEKEVWKKSSQISQTETLLEEKQEEAAEYLASLTELQHKVSVKEEEMATMRQKLSMLQIELDRFRMEESKSQAVHVSQCRQYEEQTDRLYQDLHHRELQVDELQRRAQQAQRDCQEKEQLIRQLETTLVESRQEHDTVTKHGQEVLEELEDKLKQSSQQISQLESALLLCRNEIKEQNQSRERLRQHYEQEHNTREQSILHLEQQLQEAQQEVMQRAEASMHLEQELQEKILALQRCDSRIAHLEQTEASLQASVGQLEQQLLQTKGRWMAESDELQRKLEAQGCEVDKALGTISNLRHTLKEVQEENRQLSGERSALERRLQEEIAGGHTQATRIIRLEKDVRDLRVELEQKIEIVGQLENQLQNKETDLQHQIRLVEELDVKQLQLKRELKQDDEKVAQLADQVQKLQFEIKAKEQILNDTREILRKTQAELSEKTLEASELAEAVQERQRELNERVDMVTQLERTIRETHDDMSQRMERVDATLRKYEAEIKDRSGQIADLDDKLQLTQNQLMETSLQLQQQQQLSQRQQMELQASSAMLEELQMTNQRHKQKLDEQRQENVEVTQELRLTREQLQTQHTEFLNARRELSTTRRECERLSKELEEVLKAQRCMDQDTARLSEDLGASQARTAQAEARLMAEANRFERELREFQIRHKEELVSISKARDLAQEQHASVLDRLESQSQQLAESERLYRHRLEQARSELEALQNEVTSRKELIRSANETIFMKDSEIAHLKAQLARMERMLSGQAKAELNMSSSVLRQSQLAGPSSNTANSTFAPSTSFFPFRQTNAGQTKDHYPLTSTKRHQPPSPRLGSFHSAGSNFSASAHLNSSQNASELPMKDTWNDSSEHENYVMDSLIFAFEKLEGGVEQDQGPLDCKKTEPNSEAPKQRVGSESAPKDKLPAGQEAIGVTAGLEAKQSDKVNDTVKKKSQVEKQKGRQTAKLKMGVKTQKHCERTSVGKDKGDYFHHQFEPETLIGTYNSLETDAKSKLEVTELQQQLKANALRQQEIERQLQSLDNTRDPQEDSSTNP